MKTTTNLTCRNVIVISVLLLIPLSVIGQQPLIIDHHCTDLGKIPASWIAQAKATLHIGYGHTSHGQQITEGMSAIAQFYDDDEYAFNSTGSNGALHLFEGCGYCSNGELIYDLSYEESWYPSVKKYLADHPDCNVILYSWCNIHGHNIDLYLQRMDSLVDLYGPGGSSPRKDVYFVYITGHSNSGSECEGTHEANQKIRDHCIAHNRILFDFNDIERWNPDGEYFGDADANGNYTGEHNLSDDISYDMIGGGRGNWGNEWISDHPDDTLSLINNSCSACAHSDNSKLHCVLKGMAAWWMFARLAGWDGTEGQVTKVQQDKNSGISVWPNPVKDNLHISMPGIEHAAVSLYFPDGRAVIHETVTGSEVSLPVQNMHSGWYILQITGNQFSSVMKIRIE